MKSNFMALKEQATSRISGLHVGRSSRIISFLVSENSFRDVLLSASSLRAVIKEGKERENIYSGEELMDKIAQQSEIEQQAKAQNETEREEVLKMFEDFRSKVNETIEAIRDKYMSIFHGPMVCFDFTEDYADGALNSDSILKERLEMTIRYLASLEGTRKEIYNAQRLGKLRKALDSFAQDSFPASLMEVLGLDPLPVADESPIIKEVKPRRCLACFESAAE